MGEVVSFDQALFGYDDGHRLLESSVRLSVPDTQLLLLLTDLAPGLTNLRADGYWTGAPLRESPQYALMRTWPASELPRPGCVWTHVIFVPFSHLEDSWDLKDLSQLLRRPCWPENLGSYSARIASSNVDRTFSTNARHASPVRNSYLIECVYFERCDNAPASSQEDLGVDSLAIWSQQWPELRKSFTFRTIGIPNFGKSPLPAFDLEYIAGNLKLRELGSDPILSKKWRAEGFEGDLAEDLTAEQPSQLRKFVRRYGNGLRQRVTGVPFLAWVRRNVLDISSRGLNPTSFLIEVARVLPESNDGRDLKSDLISFDKEAVVSLPASSLAAVLSFLMRDVNGSSFPPLNETGIDLVIRDWNRNPQNLLQILDASLSAKQPKAKRDLDKTSKTFQILEVLSNLIPPADLMRSTSGWPLVRRAFVRINPLLLDWDDLINVDPDEMIQLLDVFEEGDIIESRAISRLLSTSKPKVANEIIRRFPGEVLKQVCIGRGRLGHRFEANEYILKHVQELAPKFLTAGFLRGLRSTSSLSAFASMLGFINPLTIEVGPLPWATAVRDASVDTSESDTQILRAFLLALGLAHPQKGSEFVLEYSFEAIHTAMLHSTLPYSASIMLEPRLPELSWWRNWDTCLRLRTVIVETYAHAELDSKSFLRLAKENSLMGDLFEILESSNEYADYLEKVRRSVAGKARP